MISKWGVKFLPHLVVVLALTGFLAWTYGTVKEKGRAELRPVIERLQTELASERTARKRNEEAIDAYIIELDGLRNRPRPSTPVRLCVAPSVREASPATGSLDGTAASTGFDSGQVGSDLAAGPDIGPPLRELAFNCDADNAKLRALQGWVRSVVQ